MLVSIIPKLPMRNREATLSYYSGHLGFTLAGDHGEYLMFQKDDIEIHFFAYPDLDPYLNDGQVYIRVTDIDDLYQSLLSKGVAIHPNGPLVNKPWGQREFALLDPDHNLLTFGEGI